jgi:hypothetical protein
MYAWKRIATAALGGLLLLLLWRQGGTAPAERRLASSLPATTRSDRSRSGDLSGRLTAAGVTHVCTTDDNHEGGIT